MVPPLLIALRDGNDGTHIEVVKFLMSNGANVNAQENNFGYTALGLALTPVLECMRDRENHIINDITNAVHILTHIAEHEGVPKAQEELKNTRETCLQNAIVGLEKDIQKCQQKLKEDKDDSCLEYQVSTHTEGITRLQVADLDQQWSNYRHSLVTKTAGDVRQVSSVLAEASAEPLNQGREVNHG